MRKLFIIVFIFFTFLNFIKAQESENFKKVETQSGLELLYRVLDEKNEIIPFIYVEERDVELFPGGYDALAKFITNTIEYPETAIKDNRHYIQ